MDNYNEKEFSIGDLIQLQISRNDFDDLGSVLLLNFNHLAMTRHVIALSFYDEDYAQISQKNLLLLCNYENVLFDNVLMLIAVGGNINASYGIKLLNKEICYMKLFVQASTLSASTQPGRKGQKDKGEKEGNSFSQLFDLRNISAIEADSFSQLFKQGKNTLNVSESKNDNLSLIISELDKINQSLIAEKERVDQSKRALTEKEAKISQMIVRFKEEMMLFADKCYGECHNDITQRIADLQRKMSLMETNITKKYRIIKEKMKTEATTQSTMANDKQLKGNNKDKLANLEIKISFLEDTVNNLKAKLQEKENELNQNSLNEEKQAKINKKLKDELVLMQSLLKERKDKTANVPQSTIATKPQTSTQKLLKPKKLISLEINKHQLEHYNNALILSELISNNFSLFTFYQAVIPDKETQIVSLLLMNLMINPITLYNKFPFCYSLMLNKMLPLLFISSNKSVIAQFEGYLTDFAAKFPEFKASVVSAQSAKLNSSSMANETEPLISFSPNINGIDTNCNELFLSKAKAFSSFILKSKEKFTEKSNSATFKFILLSSTMIALLFHKDKEELVKLIKDIYDEYILKKDNCAIVFLIKKRYFEVVLLLINKLNGSNGNDKAVDALLFLLIDSLLCVISSGYPLLSEALSKELFNTPFRPLMKRAIGSTEHSEKVLILLSMICFEHPQLKPQVAPFKEDIRAYVANYQGSISSLIDMNADMFINYTTD